MEASTEEKRFLIRVERPWKLWFWPFVCVLYLIWILILGVGNYETPGIPTDYWVLGGMGLFAFVVFLELMLLVRRKKKAKKVRAAKVRRERHWKEVPSDALPSEPEAPVAYARPVAAGSAEAPVAAAEAPRVEEAPAPAPAPVPAPATVAAPVQVELRATEERLRGRRVLEASLPPKSRNRGAVYAKAFVPIGEDLVLRMEDLAAEPADLQA